jgi:hypothetical protein
MKELAERYETSLPQLSEAVEALSARADEHLKTIGFIV